MYFLQVQVNSEVMCCVTIEITGQTPSCDERMFSLRHSPLKLDGYAQLAADSWWELICLDCQCTEHHSTRNHMREAITYTPHIHITQPRRRCAVGLVSIKPLPTPLPLPLLPSLPPRSTPNGVAVSLFVCVRVYRYEEVVFPAIQRALSDEAFD